MVPIAQDSPTSVVRSSAIDGSGGSGGDDVVEGGYRTPERDSKARTVTPPPPPPIQADGDAIACSSSNTSSPGADVSSAPPTPVASGKTSLSPVDGGEGGAVPVPVPRQPDLLLAEAELDPDDDDQKTSLASLASGDITEREVPYSSGATELFLAIEDCRWDDAVKICRDRPDQAKVWVKSSGNEQTSFDWNVWRRLPIHEACRRQPPPILLSTLLDAHPAGSAARTHFGELPLHLAIGCGSNPESIHLLLASNPGATAELDDAGRSPSDLVHEGVPHEDRAVILGSLERCQVAQRQLEAEWSAETSRAAKRHASDLDKLAREGRKRLAVKDLALAELAREVRAGAERLEAASVEAEEREAEIRRRIQAERALAEQARTSEEEVSRLRAANRDLKKRLAELDGTVLGHETTIGRLNKRVDALAEDLRKVCGMHEDMVRNDVQSMEQEMVKLIRLQKSFLNRVRDRGDAIRTILVESDVDVPVLGVVGTGSDATGSQGNESSGDESSQSGGRMSHSAKTPLQRRQDRIAAAEKVVNEEGAAERAVAMATMHLKKEMLLSKGSNEQ